MSTPAIALHGVEKHYGRQAALRGLSLELEEGSTTLAAGPNGAGKSTLLRILATLTRPTRGEVRLFGRDPFGRSQGELRARIGYLGAEPGLYAELSVEENLRFAGQLRGVPRNRVAYVLRELELERVASQRVRTLSLGFRKRAGLARALLGGPQLLLLDEPWSGLDAAASRRLMFFLTQRLEAGTTLLIASHGVRDYLSLFGAVLTLEAGRLGGLEAPRTSHAEKL